jgi:hypothetical protein
MIRLREPPDSRELTFGSEGGGQTFRLIAVVTAGETESQVYSYVLVNSAPSFNGFLRKNIRVKPAPAFIRYEVEVEYGTTGVGGGDQPLGNAGGDGGPPPNPTAPGSDSTPLVGGSSFSISAPRIHLSQSIATVSKTKRGGGAALDFMGKIGVDKDLKVQGVDLPVEPAFTFSKNWGRGTVTTAYYKTLATLAGRKNSGTFYGWAPGEVCFLRASGSYSRGEQWSITAEFGVSYNAVSIQICDGLVVPAKRGWDYLWIYDEEIKTGNNAVVVPGAAYVEEVLQDGAFSLIEIGA